MRLFSVFAVLALSACGGSGSGSGGDGGSTGQCSDIVKQVCQKAVSCSPSGKVVFVISADADAGLNSFPFEVNGGESQCESLVGGGCNGMHAAAFTASCAGVSGFQCGPSSSSENGLLVPYACWNSL